MFDFGDNNQSFVLKQCSYTHSIKCYICVRKRELYNEDLWQKRSTLLELIETFISSVHHRHIPKAEKPIAYLECPLDHDKECDPHLRLDKIETQTVCPIVNEYISEDLYKLLLQPVNHCGELYMIK